MENELQVFKNQQFGQIELLIDENNKEWFPATDIATMLGYSNPQKAIRDHCKEKGCTIRSVLTNGGKQNKKFIDEGNLYRLIANSELPAAEKFENWIFDDVLPTIRKTGGYVNSDDLFISTYLPYADEQTKSMFKTNLSIIRKQNEVIALKDKQIEHKEEVIVGLVDEISLAEKRQVLNRVVRYKGANFQERWRELYKQFEMKYHINLKDKLENYNSSHKPKLRNKVDYIDKIMNKVPELYEIACKLYESDVKELAKNLYSLNEEAV